MVESLFEIRTSKIIKTFAAISIVLYHIGVTFHMPMVFNFWGGEAVTIFLILSGYGLSESYKKKGLVNFWHNKIYRIVIPYIIITLLSYSFFPKSSIDFFVKDSLFLSQTPTFWFIGHLLKCYIIFYISKKICPKFIIPLFVVFGIYCLNFTTQFEAEQSFSFLFGFLVSKYREQIFKSSNQKINKIAIICFGIGFMIMVLKMFPYIQTLKGTIIYNYFNFILRIPWAITILVVLYYLKISKWNFLNSIGNISLELYLVHIPLLSILNGSFDSLLLFLILTIIITYLLYLLNKYVIRNITLLSYMFVTINALYVIKYVSRISENYDIICIGYVTLMFILIKIVERVSHKFEKINIILFAGIVVSVISAFVILQLNINPYSVCVDRWSAIHFWIENLFNGEYPYAARTHLGGYGSPFPVWQILHIPFYFMNNVGMSIIVGFLLFLYTSYKLYGKRIVIISFILITISPAMWYEVAVRSDMITNFLVVCSIINYLQYKQIKLSEHILAIGIVCGLVMSTRLSAIIPFVILFFDEFIKLKASKMLQVLIIALCVFAVTFIPFVIWNGDSLMFSKYNPFVLQTRQGFISDFILFIPIGCILALRHKREKIGYVKMTSWMLFIFISVTIIHGMFYHDLFDLFSKQFDITYFNIAIPFIVLSMIEIKNQREDLQVENIFQKNN